MSTPADRSTPAMPLSLAWWMLLALIGGFALSQAYRTLAGILSVPLMEHFALSPQRMGLIAAAFHYAFGAMQLIMGIGIDVFGIRRTILLAFPLTVAGSALSALAPSASWLLVGQILIGIGCAPAFLVCTVFVARYFPPQRFAAVSGLALGLGGSDLHRNPAGLAGAAMGLAHRLWRSLRPEPAGLAGDFLARARAGFGFSR